MQKINVIGISDTVYSFFDPLVQALDDGDSTLAFLNEFGYDPPVTVDVFQEFKPMLSNFIDIFDEIEDDLDNKSELEYLQLFIKIIKAFSDAIQSTNNLSSALNTLYPAIFLSDTNIVNDLPGQLIDYLTIKALEEKFPVTHNILRVMGIINIEYVEQNAAYKKSYYKREIKWNKLGDYVSDPASALGTTYGWDNAEISYAKLLENLRVLGLSLNLYSEISSVDPQALLAFNNGIDVVTDQNFRDIRILKFPLLQDLTDALGIELYPIYNASKTAPVRIGLGVYFDPESGLEIPITEHLTFKTEYSGNSTLNAGITLRKNQGIQLITNVFDNGTTNGFELKNFAPGFVFERDDEPVVIFDTDIGARLQFKSWAIRFGIEKNETIFFETDVKELCLILGSKEGDGFIKELLPAEALKIDIDFTLGFSQKSGFYIKGSSALEIQLPVHIELGPIVLQSAVIAVKPKDGNIPVEFGITIMGCLGPLSAVVENIGVKFDISFPENNSGNMGPFNLELGFKPPNGVGLSIDACVIKGAGYLYIDSDRGEYAGALELTFNNFLSLKAIGLIATKMPDGSEGFSLLVIITAEFTIQLGYGFVFLGAGGLLGLHRTAKLTPLAEGVQTGATANLLFPTNIVENISQIISDIKVFFPICQNHFLVGPIAKIGWGQPKIIDLSLGIIIEIRTDNGGNLERIVILGVLKCILPDEQNVILKLQVNFIGAIDFTENYLFFFASIFDSRILHITIEGGMGLLVAWGSNSDFVLTVGGFHPRFNPPPLPFPVPKRISLSILNQSFGKIRASGYFAVTTNTAQFGALLEVKFGISSFRIEGSLGMDALFRFDPFFFIVEISGKVSLKIFGFGLFSVSLKFSLEGPTPWRVKGYGKVKILFFSFKARFDETWGQSKNTKLEPIKVIPIIAKELNNRQNWEAIAPAKRQLMVSLRKFPEPAADQPDPIVLHPLGKIKITQRAVPLKTTIDKVGNLKPSDANHFDLVGLPNTFDWGDDVMESFAPGQFFNKKASALLSEKATRKYTGGKYVTSRDNNLQSSKMTVRHVRYELTTIDTAYKQGKKQFYRILQALFRIFLKNNAASKSTLSNKHLLAKQPFAEKICAIAGNYVVANTSNNSLYAESAQFEHFAQAEACIQGEIEANPGLADQIHIIPANEANRSAA
ncbi:MAG: hypothetical protein GY860_13885 [Desulfobacteraceae bacterium]|nr:hypothetical protein [Desulfobacteraceae bacterium]